MTFRSATPYLRVADMDRAIAFYREGLGMAMVNSGARDGRVFWARLEKGPFSVMVSDLPARSLPHSDDEEHKHDTSWEGPGQVRGITVNSATWLYVDDADAAYADLVARGVLPLDAPTNQGFGTREFILRDPDGYIYVVAQRLA